MEILIAWAGNKVMMMNSSASDDSAVRPRRQRDLLYGEHLVICRLHRRADCLGLASPRDSMSPRKPRVWTRQLNDRLLIILGINRSRMTRLDFGPCTPSSLRKHLSKQQVRTIVGHKKRTLLLPLYHEHTHETSYQTSRQ